MKKIIIYSAIFLGMIVLYRCTDSQNNRDAVVDDTEGEELCPPDSTWNDASIVKVLEWKYNEYPWVKNIFIDDTLGAMRINIDVSYKYASYGWDLRILTTDIVKHLYETELACGVEIPGRSKFLVSINHSIVADVSSALSWVKIPMSDLERYNNPLYVVFVEYVLANLTPSDFQAYDHALKVMFEETNDPRLDSDFYTVLLKLSRNYELDENESYILNSLTTWALSKPETETREHFDYFREQVKKGW